jgi:uncharacterized protein with PIN domain
MPATYLDSSALVKLVVDEPDSAALRRYLRRRRPLISSALARTEVLRAVLLEGGGRSGKATAVRSIARSRRDASGRAFVTADELVNVA